jgi:serine phosphatase RsbU (regulator of sigma subunit)
MMLHSSYALGHASLERGDTLLLYTDGVVEARATGGTLFGMERLLTALSGPVKSAETVLSGIDKALRVHVGGAEQSDDITMLALHRSAV